MQYGPLGIDLVHSLEVPFLVWPESEQLVLDGPMKHEVTGILESLHLGPCLSHDTGKFSDTPTGESGLSMVLGNLVVFSLEPGLLGEDVGLEW